MKAERQHVPQLDGWRGIAVALVLLGHFGGDRVFPWLSSLGVDFFFVLSGRLMAEMLFVRHMPLPTFFARRFSRVYPTLLLFVIIAGCAAWGTPIGYDLHSALAALSFTLNYGVVYGLQPFTILDHVWSLCVEEHSYILLALVALACRRAPPLAAAGLIAVLGLAALINGVIRLDILKADAIATIWRTDVSMAGIFLAAGFFLLFRRNGLAAPWIWLSPLALLGALLARALGEQALIYSGLKTVLLAVAVIGIEAAPRVLTGLLESQTFRALGRCSFSLYLWQEPFYQMAGQNWIPRPLALCLALVIGLAGFALIERPARAALNQLFARPTRAAPAEA